MKIIGITRVRNEEKIIQGTLDHVSKYVDEIHVCDDASEDNTVDICNAHPKVKVVVMNPKWDSTSKGRAKAEGSLRQVVCKTAMNSGADWIYYFDADEYVEFVNIDFSQNIYFFRLFDFYITPVDVDAPFLQREWMGPEYRDIPMLFKASRGLKFTQRIPHHPFSVPVFGGYVRHYGKAMSVEEWEKTCDYYINIRWADRQPKLRDRWIARKGKAIHTQSDFGRPLINWGDRTNKDLIVKL